MSNAMLILLFSVVLWYHHALSVVGFICTSAPMSLQKVVLALPHYGFRPVSGQDASPAKRLGFLASASTKIKSTTAEDQESIRVAKSLEWQRKDLFGSSLIDETLDSLVRQPTSPTKEGTSISMNTKSSGTMTVKDENARRRRDLTGLSNIPSFAQFVKKEQHRLTADGPELTEAVSSLQRKEPKILQINIGLYCNQACVHCHVESSPLRTTEVMSAETAARCLELLKSTSSITTLDITGGAPELHEHFRYLIRMARAMRPDLIIIDRCNLTVLQEPGQEDLVDFLKEHLVQVVASLPCYTKDNVDKQRGSGIFVRSIAALVALNEAGYGIPGTGLKLDLVYNPGGAFLPGNQAALEQDYKKELATNFGVLFNSLFTLANMPIKRFADFLHQRGQLQEYMDLLINSYNPSTVENVMCRDTVSVDYQGHIYDCDFNQQLGYELVGPSKRTMTVFDIDSLSELTNYAIRTDSHCFGCTAGQGSSCQGTIAQ